MLIKPPLRLMGHGFVSWKQPLETGGMLRTSDPLRLRNAELFTLGHPYILMSIHSTCLDPTWSCILVACFISKWLDSLQNQLHLNNSWKKIISWTLALIALYISFLAHYAHNASHMTLIFYDHFLNILVASCLWAR